MPVLVKARAIKCFTQVQMANLLCTGAYDVCINENAGRQKQFLCGIWGKGQ